MALYWRISIVSVFLTGCTFVVPSNTPAPVSANITASPPVIVQTEVVASPDKASSEAVVTNPIPSASPTPKPVSCSGSYLYKSGSLPGGSKYGGFGGQSVPVGWGVYENEYDIWRAIGEYEKAGGDDWVCFQKIYRNAVAVWKSMSGKYSSQP